MAWNWRNLTTKELALLAVGATMASTFIASTASMAVAYVESRAARQLAVEASRREYRQRLMQPLLVEAEEQMVFAQRISRSLVQIGDVYPALWEELVQSLASHDERMARVMPLMALTPGIYQATIDFNNSLVKHLTLARDMSNEAKKGPLVKYEQNNFAVFEETVTAFNRLRAACEAYMFE